MLTNQDILNIATAQSAIDLNCEPGDFFLDTPKVVRSRENPQARRYLQLPFDCNLVSYGYNVVASVSERTEKLVQNYIYTYPTECCFKTPTLHCIDEKLAPLGLRTRHMAEYFLPDVKAIKALDCAYELRLLESVDFCTLYLPQWSNALCAHRKELDVLGMGAYENGRLVGLAGASADCDTMWQIGIDVLPEYRRQGVAAALASRLALEILKLDKVPFYCAAWSNIPSVRNAIRSGFRPAWVELTIKPLGN